MMRDRHIDRVVRGDDLALIEKRGTA